MTFFLQPKLHGTDTDGSDRDSSTSKLHQKKALRNKHEQYEQDSNENEENHSSLSNSHSHLNDMTMSPQTPPLNTSYRTNRKRKGVPLRAHLGSLFNPNDIC
eukprot:TRINITY_DN1957_c0_g1_i1.p1 TRINITY_DN1957_c0_g1~~TRINITY_DN1957_c0_g1_i1.p1  ORF type:complete len:102 (+),score=16.18 TRINITY_DN1957_c0_g1_i1:231-536(+)